MLLILEQEIQKDLLTTLQRDSCTAAVEREISALSPAGTVTAEISLAAEPGESSKSLSSEQLGRKDMET